MDSLPPDANELRRLTPDDLPWALSLAYKRYGAYDPGKMLVYCIDAMRSPKALFIRTPRAFLLAALIQPVWADEKSDECNILALCCEEGAVWQGIKLLRRSIEWAKEHKCRKWWFGSETKYDVGAMAKHVGAHVTHPRYKIDLS